MWVASRFTRYLTSVQGRGDRQMTARVDGADSFVSSVEALNDRSMHHTQRLPAYLYAKVSLCYGT